MFDMTKKPLSTTLGKNLVRSVHINDLSVPIADGTFAYECKEITFSIVDSPIYVYINQKDDEHKLTVNRCMSLEAKVKKFFIEIPTGSTGQLELWIWD